ncbi:22670_t:CDS:2, partial [Gigaspora margarita]
HLKELEQIIEELTKSNSVVIIQFSTNSLYELISISELRLEEHLLLSRVIQWWLDTNRFSDKKYLINCIRFNQITIEEFKDKIIDHYKTSKNNYYDFRDSNFCLRSEILDLDTAKKLITWI